MFVDAQNVFEDQPGCFSIDASELGIPPGTKYPQRIKTNLGNGLDLFFVGRQPGDVARYKQDLGMVFLDVFND